MHINESCAAAVAVFVPPFIHTDVRAMRARRNDDDDDDCDDDGDNVTPVDTSIFVRFLFCCIVKASARKRNRTTCRLHENLSLKRNFKQRNGWRDKASSTVSLLRSRKPVCILIRSEALTLRFIHDSLISPARIAITHENDYTAIDLAAMWRIRLCPHVSCWIISTFFFCRYGKMFGYAHAQDSAIVSRTWVG